MWIWPPTIGRQYGVRSKATAGVGTGEQYPVEHVPHQSALTASVFRVTLYLKPWHGPTGASSGTDDDS